MYENECKEAVAKLLRRRCKVLSAIYGEFYQEYDIRQGFLSKALQHGNCFVEYVVHSAVITMPFQRHRRSQ